VLPRAGGGSLVRVGPIACRAHQTKGSMLSGAAGNDSLAVPLVPHEGILTPSEGRTEDWYCCMHVGWQPG